MKRDINFVGSLIIGTSIFALLGWGTTQAFFQGEYLSTQAVWGSAIGGIIGLLVSLRYPLMGELLGYGIPVLISFEYFFAWGSQSSNQWMHIMFIGGLIIFALNLFTGYLRIGGGLRVIKRHLGVR